MATPLRTTPATAHTPEIRWARRRPAAAVALATLGALAAWLTGPALAYSTALLVRVRDLLLHLAGMAAIAYGCWLVYAPAGFIVAGAFVLWLQALTATSEVVE